MPTFLGIDIGETKVMVAVLRTAYRRMALVGLGSADLVGQAGQAEAIRAAVASALGKPGVGDGIAVAIDGSLVAVRTVMIPTSAQRQLAEVLPFELEAQIPFDISDSVFDYRVLKPLPGADPAQLSVLAAVARTTDVRTRIDQVKAALLAEPERVGVGAFPLANLVPYVGVLSEEGPILLVDLGAKTSDVLLCRNGEPVFSRTLDYGTEGLPQTAPRLAREIRVTIAAYRSAGGSAPTRVLLSGAGAFVSGAEAFLAGELELPVAAIPAPALEVENVDPALFAELPRFAKSIGLALGLTGRAVGVDLRRGPLAYERGFAWIKEKVPVLAGLGAVIMVSFFFSAGAQLYASAKERSTLESALGIVTGEVLGEATSSADRATEMLTQQVGTVDEDPLPHADAFDVMVKLSEDIPMSMVHDIEELDVQKGHVVVRGVVGSIPDAQAIATSLRNEKCFQEVKITRTNQVVGGERQKYVLEFDLKCPEDVKGPAKKPGAAAATPATSGGGK